MLKMKILRNHSKKIFGVLRDDFWGMGAQTVPIALLANKTVWLILPPFFPLLQASSTEECLKAKLLSSQQSLRQLEIKTENEKWTLDNMVKSLKEELKALQVGGAASIMFSFTTLIYPGTCH